LKESENSGFKIWNRKNWVSSMLYMVKKVY